MGNLFMRWWILTHGHLKIDIIMVYDKSKNMVVRFPPKKGMDMCKHTQNPIWMVDDDLKSIYYLPQICFGWNDFPELGFDRHESMVYLIHKKMERKKHGKHPNNPALRNDTKLVQLQVCLRVVYCWFNGFPAKIATG